MSGFPTAPADLPDEREHRRRLAAAANLAMAGKLNATLDVTLTVNQMTTAVNDPRLTAASFIGFCPLTANAAGEMGNGTLYVAAQSSGALTLGHANNAQSDRSFRLLVIG